MIADIKDAIANVFILDGMSCMLYGVAIDSSGNFFDYDGRPTYQRTFMACLACNFITRAFYADKKIGIDLLRTYPGGVFSISNLDYVKKAGIIQYSMWGLVKFDNFQQFAQLLHLAKNIATTGYAAIPNVTGHYPYQLPNIEEIGKSEICRMVRRCLYTNQIKHPHYYGRYEESKVNYILATKLKEGAL